MNASKSTVTKPYGPGRRKFGISESETTARTLACHGALVSNATMVRKKRAGVTPNLTLLVSSPNRRSARRRPASVTRFSLLRLTRPPFQDQPALGSLRSSPPLVNTGWLPSLVYSTVVNGEVGRIVGDSRKNQ